LFNLAKAINVPCFMVLNLLGFMKSCFVGKLTKWMNGYDKRTYWSIIDGAYRPTCMIRIAPYVFGGNWRGLIHGIWSIEREVFAKLGWLRNTNKMAHQVSEFVTSPNLLHIETA
jgi:hypothetical protein